MIQIVIQIVIKIVIALTNSHIIIMDTLVPQFFPVKELPPSIDNYYYTLFKCFYCNKIVQYCIFLLKINMLQYIYYFFLSQKYHTFVVKVPHFCGKSTTLWYFIYILQKYHTFVVKVEVEAVCIYVEISRNRYKLMKICINIPINITNID